MLFIFDLYFINRTQQPTSMNQKTKLCKTCSHFTVNQPKTESGVNIGASNTCRLFTWYMNTEEDMAVECDSYQDRTGPNVDIHNIINRLEKIEKSPIYSPSEIESTPHVDNGGPVYYIEIATINNS